MLAELMAERREGENIWLKVEQGMIAEFKFSKCLFDAKRQTKVPPNNPAKQYHNYIGDVANPIQTLNHFI